MSLFLASPRKKDSVFRKICRHWVLYVFLFAAFLYLALFAYAPMYGIQIAFRNYSIASGFLNSPWVGLKWFRTFFSSNLFSTLLVNTVALSLYGLIVGFPLPIILALSLNYVKNMRFKRIMQTATYLPHFISIVVLVGMLSVFLSPRSGFINNVIQTLTGNVVYFFGKPEYFRHVYVWSGVWQGTGWGSIIYMAALSSVNPELHESAVIDGANILKRIWHIDIPSIMPTMVIMLILSSGGIMSIGFEKVYLLQNSLNIATAEVISTYTYKIGLLQQNYSYSTAIGLFNNVINFILLTLVNKFANKLSGYGLW